MPPKAPHTSATLAVPQRSGGSVTGVLPSLATPDIHSACTSFTLHHEQSKLPFLLVFIFHRHLFFAVTCY